MTDAHQEEVDFDVDEEVVCAPKLVKDEEDPPNPQLDPLEVAMPTDVLPSQPPSASDPSQPTQFCFSFSMCRFTLSTFSHHSSQHTSQCQPTQLSINTHFDQPIALPVTLSCCNLSRDSTSSRPFFCIRCQQGFQL